MLFKVYGTEINTHLDLGEFPSRGSASGYSVRVREGTAQLPERAVLYTDEVLNIHGKNVRAWQTESTIGLGHGDGWLVEVEGLCRFAWGSERGTLEYRKLTDCEDSLLAFWLIHLILPFYLSAEYAFVFMHASAVEIEGKAVLFVAPSGSGKSTLAAAFNSLGYALLADDKLATHPCGDGFKAVPSHSRMRPYRRFEDLGRKAEVQSAGAVPVAAIIVPQRGEGPDITLAPVTGARSFELLGPNMLYGFLHGARHQFNYMGALVDAVPLFELSYPDGLDRLDEVCSSVVALTSGYK